MAERILVVGPAWIGDMVMAQSLFKLIKQRRPQAQIDVVAPAWTEPLLARMPEVAQAFSLPVGHGDLALGTRWKLGRRLREWDYEQAIILPNSLKSALIPFVASVRRRTGFLGEYRWGLLNDVRRLDKKMLPRRVDTYIALGLDKEEPMLTSIPQPTLNASRSDAHAALTRLARPRLAGLAIRFGQRCANHGGDTGADRQPLSEPWWAHKSGRMYKSYVVGDDRGYQRFRPDARGG
jgi:heptosyltransferase-2